jgi:hypothetical protein
MIEPLYKIEDGLNRIIRPFLVVVFFIHMYYNRYKGHNHINEGEENHVSGGEGFEKTGF